MQFRIHFTFIKWRSRGRGAGAFYREVFFSSLWIDLKMAIVVLDAYLLWCLATLHIYPESSNIDNQTDDGNYEEFDLQMSCDDFQQQFNFGFQYSTNHEQLHECTSLLLFAFASFC